MYSLNEITVFFEEPFWIALIERKIDDQYSVARAIIGTSEPLGANLADFFEHLNFNKLRFTVSIDNACRITKEISYKKQLHKTKEIQKNTTLHVYTKAHAMLKQQQSVLKTEKKQATRSAKEEEMQLKYDMRQQKKKNKHNGH